MAQAQPQMSFGNYPLKDIPAPHPHDVLCGRGGGTNNHVGNSHWRMLVAANKQLYVTLPKRQKMLLSRSIVNAVRSQNPPGRFLQKDAKSDLWYDVGDQRAQEKTSQALREGAPDIRSKITGTKGETLSTDEPTTPNTTDSAVTSTPQNSLNSNTPTQPVPSTTSSNTGLAHMAPAPPQKPLMQQTPAPAMMPPVTTPFPAPAAGAPAAPPGSTPVMVYAMPQNGMPGVPMYQALMTPQGTMVPNSMQAPSLSSSIPPQGPTNNNNNTKNPPNNELMPPPANQSPSQNMNLYQPAAATAVPNATGHLEPISEFDQAAMMTGALEPSGISFGSVSMMSVGNGKLEAAGTSFGSMMSFTVASTKAPGMVDGGLEPIGTSFGSLSLNSGDQNALRQALSGTAHQQQPANINSFATPTLLSQQRSQGNLLECSDTESEDDEEEAAPNGASKSVEWEKLKSMLESHTNMEQSSDMPPGQHQYQQQPQQFQQQIPQQYQQQNQQFGAMPPTVFYENISALGMGDFGNGDGDFNDAMAMPPPPPMNAKPPDDDLTPEERQQLQMMMLAEG
eukprot:CAMPEP_0119032280 /NCGR_PEP_ID=MMETSP1176-20130426/41973_1 /TAXON_ID=265551 /ORGANISM="Synedropsis recta cf, Strain CCMP1620" /LENGTH=562 /DNA_ID=CAMNT_0006988691 /DNA_START=150 /DNA_END=1835 /DNA_ORIENTATION=-